MRKFFSYGFPILFLSYACAHGRAPGSEERICAEGEDVVVQDALAGCEGDKKESEVDEKHIVIVTASYNNEQCYKWNLDSVFAQRYSNWNLIYVDDCSPDKTYELVKKHVKEKNDPGRAKLIHNTERKRALANLYTAIYMCDDTDIIVILDGDDRFPEDKNDSSGYKQVLAYINNVYADPNVWLTYGQYREFPSRERGFCKQYPKRIIERNDFRRWPDTPSHLRTFYAGLFKRIKKEDLLFEGAFFPMTYDLAMMFPMIEMARDHFRFIPEILLEYNASNPLNDHKVSKKLQRSCDIIIRSRLRYEKLDNLFDGN